MTAKPQLDDVTLEHHLESHINALKLLIEQRFDSIDRAADLEKQVSATRLDEAGGGRTWHARRDRAGSVCYRLRVELRRKE